MFFFFWGKDRVLFFTANPEKRMRKSFVMEYVYNLCLYTVLYYHRNIFYVNISIVRYITFFNTPKTNLFYPMNGIWIFFLNFRDPPICYIKLCITLHFLVKFIYSIIWIVLLRMKIYVNENINNMFPNYIYISQFEHFLPSAHRNTRRFGRIWTINK